MRLSRPVALGLLVLCVAVVLWLVVQTLGAQDGAAPTQGATGPAATQETDEPVGTGSDEPPGETDESVDTESGEPAGPDETDDPGAPGDDPAPSGVDTRPWDGIDPCRDDVLPPELEEVADDVEAGGPFEHPGKDGSTFGNYEGYLPQESRGYYREFTVQTPGLDHRGARRIVTGGEGWDPEVWYYTDDHYESFCEFAP